MQRKIVAVTGARSEYDLLYPVYRALNEDDRFDFSIIITGAHLSEKYGLSAKLIENSGLKVADEIFNLIDSNQRIGRVISLGNQIQSLAMSLNRINPDIVLVAGDREESLSVTTTCAYMDIPVAHFFGGDIAKDGNIDNSVRYAASKLAHIHFPSMESHKETLLKLGEDEHRIFVVGNPSIDKLLEVPNKGKKILSQEIEFDVENDDYFVLIQHSIISEAESQSEIIRITLDTIVDSGSKCFINYPNSDAGNHDIILAYQEYASTYPEQFKLFQNLDRDLYINLLQNAKCLLGNSSSGLTEAPSLGLPVINIGKRQRDRTHGDNILFVDNDKQQILDALSKIDSPDFMKKVNEKRNPYGNGDSAQKVIKALADIKLDNHLVHKNITY